MTAHILIDVDPRARGQANIQWFDISGGFDFVAVAAVLDLYADDRPVPLLRHHETFKRNDVEIPRDHRVLLAIIDADGSVQLNQYGPDFGEYYARGCAHYLRTQASLPQMQQAALQALAAADHARMQAQAMQRAAGPNGESLDQIARGIILPGNGR